MLLGGTELKIASLAVQVIVQELSPWLVVATGQPDGESWFAEGETILNSSRISVFLLAVGAGDNLGSSV